MAGRRLMLVHLFLPDTLDFHDWPDEQQTSHFRVPSQLKGDDSEAQKATSQAPPSPPPIEGNDLPAEELNFRLKRASVRDDDGADSDNAISDTEAPALPTLSANHSASVNERRRSRGSFNEQNKKVSMTSLMSEAANPTTDPFATGTLPASTGLGPSSRRNSSNNPIKPLLSESKIPAGTASDHGRSAEKASTMPLPISKSRRGSASASGSMQTSISSNSLTVPTVNRQNETGAGTRTPGARAGGKAGTMTPLSIIGDLAAKQSVVPTRQLATPGDTDRHHPFGSGAVTPMRSDIHSTGTGSRTPGPRPGQISRPITGLTKLNENSSSSSNPRSPNPRSTNVSRPPLQQQHNRVSEGAVPSSMDHAFTRTHGRTANDPPPAHKRPGLTSRQASQTSPFRPVSNQSNSTFAAQHKSDTTNLSSNQTSQTSSTAYHPTTGPTGPPAAPSAAWTRGSRIRGATRQGIGAGARRQSSVGSRSIARTASVDTFVGDEMTMSHLESDSPPLLPPYDLIPNPSSNGGLVNAIRSLPESGLRGGKVFIGTPGVTTNEWAGDREKSAIEKRFKSEKDSIPVWVDDDTFDGAYAHFCKQILWPTFHYTTITRKGLDWEHEGFECYQRLNKKFAAKIVQEYKEGDIVFINDYHLLLVPELVREQLPHAKICFFLHIAWPSSEIFRCLSARTFILKGMLGADLVGFQTQNFARHFRQTVSRILQLEATPKGILVDGRGSFVTVATFPIGIDVQNLNERRAQPDVGEWVARLQERYEGKKVIVGRDKLDSIKGVRQKLLAFETALEEHPNLVGEVVLLQVALATTEENEEVAAATDVVSRINNKFSTLTYQPVVFLHVQDITFCQYLALLTIADAFLATSLREGMNLTSHEFVICQEVRKSPLILSEFTGTYSSLRACIGINPWNTKQVADAIYKAVTMDKEEASERWKDLQRQVKTQDAQHWIQSLLGRLERAHIDQLRRNNQFVPRLEIGQSEWRASKSRLVLLDLEGTLMPDDPVSMYEKGFEPTDEVVKILVDLTDDPKNRVYVLSGKGAKDLDKLVARAPRIGLVAENGCSVMYAGSTSDDPKRHLQKSWTSLVGGTNMSWREPVKEILSYFTERTPGSWLEDRGASILWRFWSQPVNEDTPKDKDFSWSRRQAAEVQNLIYDSLGERFSLRIIPGKTSFLIMPKNTSRASAVQHIVSLSHVGVQYGYGQSAAAVPASIIGGEKNGNSTEDAPLLPSPLPLLSPTGGPPSSVVANNANSFRQPSNDWSMAAWHEQFASPRHNNRQSSNTHMLHPYGLGSFDLVLCIGQDDMLFAYINSLDLPFAPITCTSVGRREEKGLRLIGVGSEANYYIDGVENVLATLTEILAFRGRDKKWGVPAMVDV